MEKIKPCPFCGNVNSPRLMTRHGKDGWRNQYYILCDYDDGGCGASSGWCHSQEEAIACWNCREEIQWINADIKLPENSDAVLAILQYAPKWADHITIMMAMCRYDGTNWLRDGSRMRDYIQVIYWKPLPEYPEEFRNE